jgi:hypothetical protein
MHSDNHYFSNGLISLVSLSLSYGDVEPSFSLCNKFMLIISTSTMLKQNFAIKIAVVVEVNSWLNGLIDR